MFFARFRRGDRARITRQRAASNSRIANLRRDSARRSWRSSAASSFANSTMIAANFSGLSFGRSAWQNNTNPGTVSRGANEFNAGGFEEGLDLQKRPRSALGNAIYGL